MKNLETGNLILGMMSTNCYLLKNRETGAALIVDPAEQPDRIADTLKGRKAKPEAILLTHGHFDHIGAAEKLREAYQIPILAHEREREVLDNPDINLTKCYGTGYTLKADRYLEDGEMLKLAGFEIKVLYTPGHTIGSTSYYLPNEAVLFSGDTLFCGSVGRTDFPTGSEEQLLHSLHEKLFTLPDDTDVFPGHEGATTIYYEKRFNPCA